MLMRGGTIDNRVCHSKAQPGIGRLAKALSSPRCRHPFRAQSEWDTSQARRGANRQESREGTIMSRDAAEIARLSAEAMWQEDKASPSFGMSLDSIGPGHAVMSMAVRADMVNGHGTCHGGFIFMLADSAFGFACSSRGQRQVAQNCQITYLAPARLDMRLTAEARERYREDRASIFDVTVRGEAGQVIAEFRGYSRAVPGALVPES